MLLLDSEHLVSGHFCVILSRQKCAFPEEGALSVTSVRLRLQGYDTICRSSTCILLG